MNLYSDRETNAYFLNVIIDYAHPSSNKNMKNANLSQIAHFFPKKPDKSLLPAHFYLSQYARATRLL